MSLALNLNLIWILCHGFHHFYFLTSTTQFYFIDVLWMILTSRCIQNVCPAPLHPSLQYNQISYPLSVPDTLLSLCYYRNCLSCVSPTPSPTKKKKKTKIKKQKNRLLPALPHHNEDFFWN